MTAWISWIWHILIWPSFKIQSPAVCGFSFSLTGSGGWPFSLFTNVLESYFRTRTWAWALIGLFVHCRPMMLSHITYCSETVCLRNISLIWWMFIICFNSALHGLSYLMSLQFQYLLSQSFTVATSYSLWLSQGYTNWLPVWTYLEPCTGRSMASWPLPTPRVEPGLKIWDWKWAVLTNFDAICTLCRLEHSIMFSGSLCWRCSLIRWASSSFYSVSCCIVRSLDQSINIRLLSKWQNALAYT